MLVDQQKLKYQDAPNLAIAEIIEMDNRITLDKQLEENSGPVILINKINAGVEMPEWMTRWITETSLEELDVDEAGVLRAILFDHIHEKLRMNAHLLAMKNDGVIDIETRISICLDNNLLSFIREAKSENGTQVYHIDSSILMLFENRLPDLTLKRLGEKMGFEYKHTRSVLRCTREQI